MKQLTGVLGEIMKNQAKKDNQSEGEESDSSESDVESSKNSRKRKRSSSSSSSPSSSSSSSGSSSSSSSSESSPKRKRDLKKMHKKISDKFNVDGKELDKEKLKEAIEKEKQRKKNKNYSREAEKRYNSFKGEKMNVTAEELEAYRIQRELFEDPMRNYKPSEDNL